MTNKMAVIELPSIPNRTPLFKYSGWESNKEPVKYKANITKINNMIRIITPHPSNGLTPDSSMYSNISKEYISNNSEANNHVNVLGIITSKLVFIFILIIDPRNLGYFNLVSI